MAELLSCNVDKLTTEVSFIDHQFLQFHWFFVQIIRYTMIGIGIPVKRQYIKMCSVHKAKYHRP